MWSVSHSVRRRRRKREEGEEAEGRGREAESGGGGGGAVTMQVLWLGKEDKSTICSDAKTISKGRQISQWKRETIHTIADKSPTNCSHFQSKSVYYSGLGQAKPPKIPIIQQNKSLKLVNNGTLKLILVLPNLQVVLGKNLVRHRPHEPADLRRPDKPAEHRWRHRGEWRVHLRISQ
ncbi:hypothetical protein PoB_005673400 [Plakobranchus ocellatus]|uniref:Uncharacterized protein n=1 Tax=Plakobranchus ocellatus TaxID=259542 RepID=A0AAV4CCB0_9GAST|nr:hypothetical protein PoB_005673400 [Plakobranchus ocellatus]